MSFKVIVDGRGVHFNIDHQGFRLAVEDDPEQPKKERYRWYAHQLRIALKRLEGKSTKPKKTRTSK